MSDDDCLVENAFALITLCSKYVIVLNLIEIYKMCRNLWNRFPSDTTYIMFQFLKFHKELLSYSSHISFIRYCIRFHLKLRFLSFRLGVKDQHTSHQLSKLITEKWLRNEFRKWYREQNVANRLALFTYEELTGELHPFELYMSS